MLAIFFSFFLILLPGWALYVSGHREEKKAAEPLRVVVDPKRRRENAELALIVGFILTTILTLIVGVWLLNWYLLVPGFIMFGILVVIASWGQAETGHAGYYMWGAGRGRIWRMSAAHRANKR